MLLFNNNQTVRRWRSHFKMEKYKRKTLMLSTYHGLEQIKSRTRNEGSNRKDGANNSRT